MTSLGSESCQVSALQNGKTFILIADDSATIRALLRRTLELYSYEVIEARDGEEAVVRVRETPDLGMLIVDLMMPKLDGIEVIRIVRARASSVSLPILVLTGESLGEVTPVIPGADACMQKPFLPSVLLDIVRNLLAHGHRTSEDQLDQDTHG